MAHLPLVRAMADPKTQAVSLLAQEPKLDAKASGAATHLQEAQEEEEEVREAIYDILLHISVCKSGMSTTLTNQATTEEV